MTITLDRAAQQMTTKEREKTAVITASQATIPFCETGNGDDGGGGLGGLGGGDGGGGDVTFPTTSG